MTQQGRVQGSGIGRIVMALLGTVTVVVLLFGYRTSTGTPVDTSIVVSASGSGAADAPSSGDASSGDPGNTDSSDASVSGGAPDSGGSAGSATSYTGDAVGTRWGDVQVQITVANGVITAVDAVEVPGGNQRDIEINNRAVPILAAEALRAQSAQIDTVSGATVTSEGYLASLQSAIDQAGL